MREKYLAVSVPVFTEEGNLKPLVEQICAALHDLPKSFEILLIDDGSNDGSFNEMVACQEDHPELRIIKLDKNSGQSEALVAGIRSAKSELIATLDADLQNDPADIARLLQEMGDYDMICGYRANRQDNWWRRFCSRVANSFRRMICPDPVRDTGCSLKLFKAEVFEHAPFFRGSHRFLATLAEAGGFSVTETAVNHRPRSCGVTKYGAWGRLKRSFVDLFGMSWLVNRRIRARVAKEVPPRA